MPAPHGSPVGQGVASRHGSERGDRHHLRLHTPPGRDPDTLSPTLKQYHKLLWSKPLPSGALVELDDTTPGEYLHHLFRLGEFFLTSDAVVPSFTREMRLRDVINRIPRAELDEFNRIGYTIGGMMLFPGTASVAR
jgi:hypothetical protein